MKDTFTLERELWLPHPPDQVFPFFSDAHNLESITPPSLRFEVLTPRPIEMRAGALIDYRLRVHGIPLRWRSRIAVWDPPRRFVDEQVVGPYREWVHEHTFEPNDTGTLCRDRVRYSMYFPRLTRFLVRRDLERIFAFRSQRLQEIFAASGSARS